MSRGHVLQCPIVCDATAKSWENDDTTPVYALYKQTISH